MAAAMAGSSSSFATSFSRHPTQRNKSLHDLEDDAVTEIASFFVETETVKKFKTMRRIKSGFGMMAFGLKRTKTRDSDDSDATDQTGVIQKIRRRSKALLGGGSSKKNVLENDEESDDEEEQKGSVAAPGRNTRRTSVGNLPYATIRIFETHMTEQALLASKVTSKIFEKKIKNNVLVMNFPEICKTLQLLGLDSREAIGLGSVPFYRLPKGQKIVSENEFSSGLLNVMNFTGISDEKAHDGQALLTAQAKLAYYSFRPYESDKFDYQSFRNVCTFAMGENLNNFAYTDSSVQSLTEFLKKEKNSLGIWYFHNGVKKLESLYRSSKTLLAAFEFLDFAMKVYQRLMNDEKNGMKGVITPARKDEIRESIQQCDQLDETSPKFAEELEKCISRIHRNFCNARDDNLNGLNKVYRKFCRVHAKGLYKQYEEIWSYKQGSGKSKTLAALKAFISEHPFLFVALSRLIKTVHAIVKSSHEWPQVSAVPHRNKRRQSTRTSEEA